MRLLSKLVASLPLIAGICCTTSAAVVRRAIDSDNLSRSLRDLAEVSRNVTVALEHCEKEDKNDPFYQDIVLDRLAELTQTTHELDTAMEGTQAFTNEADQQRVCDSYDNFVTTEQVAMDAFVRKSFFRTTSAGKDMVTGLNALDEADNSLGSKLINVVPVCADAATEDKNSLDAAVKKAICVFTDDDNC